MPSCNQKCSSEGSSVRSLNEETTEGGHPPSDHSDVFPVNVTINSLDIGHELALLSNHGYSVRGQRDASGRLQYGFSVYQQPKAVVDKEDPQVKLQTPTRSIRKWALMAVFKSGFITGRLLGNCRLRTNKSRRGLELQSN